MQTFFRTQISDTVASRLVYQNRPNADVLHSNEGPSSGRGGQSDILKTLAQFGEGGGLKGVKISPAERQRIFRESATVMDGAVELARLGLKKATEELNRSSGQQAVEIASVVFRACTEAVRGFGKLVDRVENNPDLENTRLEAIRIEAFLKESLPQVQSAILNAMPKLESGMDNVKSDLRQMNFEARMGEAFAQFQSQAARLKAQMERHAGD